jgi:hypothetical protein
MLPLKLSAKKEKKPPNKKLTQKIERGENLILKL